MKRVSTDSLSPSIAEGSKASKFEDSTDKQLPEDLVNKENLPRTIHALHQIFLKNAELRAKYYPHDPSRYSPFPPVEHKNNLILCFI